MDARSTQPGDAAARRGLVFVLGAMALVPLVVAVVASLPEGGRGAVFEIGVLCSAAIALCGGVVAWHALRAGTHRAVTAYAAAILGLVVGITLVLVGISSGIGLLS
ncbi:MAG TPA: hypothetical protein VJ736_06310 [Actinomycetota bacterium]|nr:hypothetical protein [Actinomycetota bacterium]